jgi:hypothetical protein
MSRRWACVAAAAACPLVLAAQQGRGNPFPGGTNPDGSLRPTAPLTRFFTQDAYTEYEILAPGSASFRITFLPEESRVGATELVNATRGGSEGSDIAVYDPRTGKPLEFTYAQQGSDPDSHAIRARLPRPVPAGGVGRVVIYKTYKDDRTYQMNGDDIVWVRSLSGYRLGVVLPRGFGFLSANVAAHLSTTASGQLKLGFANPSGQSNPVTIHARKTTAAFPPAASRDVFFDDVKTLYELQDPATSPGLVRVEQIYSDGRKGARARLDALAYLPLQDLTVVDLDTAERLAPERDGAATYVPLAVPIVDDRQSAHLRLSGTLARGYRVEDGTLVFERALHGLRNTVVLPAGWLVTGVSEAGTIGVNQGRQFVALLNLNASNQYTVTIRARRGQ